MTRPSTAERIVEATRAQPGADAAQIAARVSTTPQYVHDVWRAQGIQRPSSATTAARPAGSPSAAELSAAVSLPVDHTPSPAAPAETDATAGPVPRVVRCRGYRRAANGSLTGRRCGHQTTRPDGLCGWEGCGEDLQHSLFDTSPGGPGADPRGTERRPDRWLRDLSEGVFAVIGADSLLWAGMERASTAAAGQSTSVLEQNVAQELADPALQAHLLDQVRAHAANAPFQTLAQPTGLSFRYMEQDARAHAAGDGERDRMPADIMCDLSFEDGTTLAVPINVKWVRVGTNPNGAEAVNRRTILHGIKHGYIEGRGIAGQNPSGDLLDLYADNFQMRPFDYYLLEIVSDKRTGKLYGVRWQGLLSTETDDGKLSISQHSTRPDTTCYRQAQRPISDSHDLRASLLEGLNRTPTPEQLKLAVLTTWERASGGRDDALVKRRARALIDADPQAVLGALEAMFAHLEQAGEAAQAEWPKAHPSLLD